MEEAQEHIIPPASADESTAMPAFERTARNAAQPMRVFTGIVALSLVFAASAGATFAYFTDQSPAPAAHEEAAAVVAVEEPDLNAYSGIALQAQSAYVYDIKLQRPLFALNPDQERPLASLTKVAMALAVSQALSPNTTITIPYDTAAPGTVDGLFKGDLWREEDLMNFTLMMSNNDGADFLAASANQAIHDHYPLAPLTSTTSATVWRMNDIASSLGLSDMYFINDNGLDISDTQSGAYGSARDVAALMAYAASTSEPVFADTVKSDLSFTTLNGNKAYAVNTDEALGDIPGIIMGKTGYTTLAGGNLAVVFDVGPDHPVVAVVMGSTESGRFSDMERLVSATITAINDSTTTTVSVGAH